MEIFHVKTEISKNMSNQKKNINWCKSIMWRSNISNNYLI